MAQHEDGFTLIEVLLATTLFVFVALAGFEVIRHLSATATLTAQRADAAAQMHVAVAALRSDAVSAVAIWKPASTCGDAVELMRRDAGGISFALYEPYAGGLVRATAAGPMNPCDDALQRQTLIAAIAGVHVAQVAASALPAHTDPISAQADGTVFAAAGITEIAVDAHARDLDGSTITTGNDVVEVTIDADPVTTPVDLVAGNRPSAYTHVLTYTCNGRCEAAARFPELRGAPFTDCTPGYAFQNAAVAYVPAAYGFANGHLVVTAYSIAAGYSFTFAGTSPVEAVRAWPLAVWPPAGSALAGTIADPYPVDYANNAVAARGIAQIAADLGEPAAFAADLAACADMHDDPTFDG